MIVSPFDTDVKELEKFTLTLVVIIISDGDIDSEFLLPTNEVRGS